MKKFIRKFHYGEKGFTLIELLVVVAILGVLAAVAVPNVGKFIGEGKTESYAAELHNIETAVAAMNVDSDTNVFVAVTTASADMSGFTTTDTVALVLSDYLTGLNGTSTTSGCTYTMTTAGAITQVTP